MNLHTQTAREIAQSVHKQAISCREVVEAALRQITNENSALNAVITICEAEALQAAASLDQAVAAGRSPGVLAGVPVVVKDNLCTKNIQTTAGSQILAGHIPPYSATAVSRLQAAGAIVVAKANLDEFAMGSSCEHSAYGPTRNPWNHAHVPGGSSGGSAAAAAAGWAPITLGSDTGGSIRQPAALCGVYGLKPTWGRVSRYGLVAFASSLDQVGPFTRSASDMALTLQVLAGYDPADLTSSSQDVPDYESAVASGIEGMRIGYCPEWLEGEGVQPAVARTVRQAIQNMQDLGGKVTEIRLPNTQEALATYYVLAPAEASSNLARFDGVRFGARVDGPSLHSMYNATRGALFGDEVRRRILLGTFVLSDGYQDAFYGKAQRVRTKLSACFQEAFTTCDVIMSPTSPVVAPRIGDTTDPMAMYRMDEFTIGANLAGLPAMNIPCGKADGLPVGLQVLAPSFGEEHLFRVAGAYERHMGRPEIAS